MPRDVLLDTGVIIGLERHRLRPERVYQQGDQLAISALTATELLVGAELAPAQLTTQVRHAAESTLNALYILDYDLRVARVHAMLLAHVTRTGRPRGAFDLAIAATAVAYRRLLITTDGKTGFDDLPGLDVEVVGQRPS